MMKRRSFILSMAAIVSSAANNWDSSAMTLNSTLEHYQWSLQTNSETPTPDLATLPWEEVVYVGMLSTWYEILRDSLSTFFNGLSQLTENLTNVSLRAGVVLGVGVWTHLYADVANITPPTVFDASHGFFKDALSKLNATSSALSLGIIRGDADLLTSSLEGLDSADASLRSFVAALPYAVPDRSEMKLQRLQIRDRSERDIFQ